MQKKSIIKNIRNETHRVLALLSVLAIAVGLAATFYGFKVESDDTMQDGSSQAAESVQPENSEDSVDQTTTATPISDQANPVATLTPIPPIDDVLAASTVIDPANIEVVINKLLELPGDYTPAQLIQPSVASASSGILLRSEAAIALESLFTAAEQSALPLQLVSGYRSYETQQSLFANYAATFGELEANRFSARAGQSEHQTGLAADVSGTDGVCVLETCYGATNSGVWVAQNAAQYGFIVRYPAGAEGITGYSYEPWHLRYVGADLAQQIASSGLTMEQYLQ